MRIVESAEGRGGAYIRYERDGVVRTITGRSLFELRLQLQSGDFRGAVVEDDDTVGEPENTDSESNKVPESPPLSAVSGVAIAAPINHPKKKKRKRK